MSGNAIKNSKPIKKEDFPTLTTNLKAVLPGGLHFYPYGSIGKKSISTDVDFFINITELLSIFPASDVSESRKLLQNHFIDQGLESSRSGVSVFVGIPVHGELVQVDLTTVDDAYNMMYLHDHIYENENMKGKDVVSIWCDLANITSTSLKISPYRGLVNRETNQLMETDPGKIAKIIISPSATVDDMRSPARLLEAVKHDPIKYQHIKQTYFQ